VNFFFIFKCIRVANTEEGHFLADRRNLGLWGKKKSQLLRGLDGMQHTLEGSETGRKSLKAKEPGIGGVRGKGRVKRLRNDVCDGPAKGVRAQEQQDFGGKKRQLNFPSNPISAL